MPFTHASALRSAFRRIVLAGLVVPCAVACTTGGGAGAEGDGGLSCRSLEPDAGKGACGWSVKITGYDACGFKPEGSVGGSSEYGSGDAELCKRLCGHDETVCTGYKSTNGEENLVCGQGCEGRRYDALDDASAPVARDAATYLARMAFFEAASIDAFAILARELARHGAPTSLVRACLAARADEVKHARMAKTVAERRGATFVAPPAPSHPARSLEALAIENAVEGCVREAFGVVLGMWQAVHAPTRELRAFFATLAHDEARHAALAWRVDAWLATKLDADARARVEAAREEALGAVVREAAMGPDGVGLPNAQDGAVLARAFVDEVRGMAIAA